jgi:hypothetical protein
MDAVSATQALASLTPDKKARMVAMLCHELTIVARDTYGEGTEVKAPGRLRAVNEIEHRMTGFMAHLLEHGSSDCPHDAIVRMFFSDREDKHLQRLLAYSFERVGRLFSEQSL